MRIVRVAACTKSDLFNFLHCSINVKKHYFWYTLASLMRITRGLEQGSNEDFHEGQMRNVMRIR